MLKINPYLNFDGNAEEVFNFYKSVFGGEFTPIQRFKDIPAGEKPMPKEEENRIMHIGLKISENAILMASDISDSMGMSLVKGNNNYISLTPDNKEEGQRLFNELSAGGHVEMPYEKMFWGDYFGSFTDKFGVCWMIDVEDK